MTSKQNKDDEKFLFSRSRDLSESDLVATPDGQTYEKIRAALREFRAQAIAEHKAKAIIEAKLHHHN